MSLEHQTYFIVPSSVQEAEEERQQPIFTSVPMFESSSATRENRNTPSSLFERSESQDCFIGGDFWSTTFGESNALTPPRSVLRRQQQQQQHDSNETVSTMNQCRRRHTWTSFESPSSKLTWLPAPTLKRVPPYYPLEKSAVTIHGVSVEDIVSRASSFLRLNSISAIYHKQHAECRTGDFLKFVIQLWNGDEEEKENMNGDNDDDDNSQSSKSVIVEVQRRQGCCLQMRKVRLGLLEAMKMGMEQATDFSSSVFQPSLLPTTSWAQQQQQRRPPSSTSARLRARSLPPDLNWDPIDMTINLLESRCVDQNQLGLESLSHLADHDSAQQSHAHEVSMGLVCGEGTRGTRLRDALVHYICNVEEGKDSDDENDYDSMDEDELLSDSSHTYDQGSQFGVMHNLVLTALSNALRTLSTMIQDENNALKDIDVEVDYRSCFWQWTIEALVYNIEIAGRRPQEAAKSTVCLHLLFTLAPKAMRSPDIIHRLPRALCIANNVGKVCHFKLERESEQLMQSIADVE